MNEKCRHHSPEANHAFSFHLCCLSDVNFEVELSEKIRFYLVPKKIHVHLWFIALVTYTVEFMVKNGTTFIFTFLKMVKKLARSKIQKCYQWWLARGRRWSVFRIEFILNLLQLVLPPDVTATAVVKKCALSDWSIGTWVRAPAIPF